MSHAELTDDLRVDLASIADRVLDRCHALARHSDRPGSLYRPFAGEAMREAQAELAAWMADCGLQTRVDAACNLRGSLPCQARWTVGRRLLIGSHLDSVPNAGRFDGPLGILLGLGVAEALQEAGAALPFDLDVVAFSDEEGARFGLSYLGSRALAGCFDSDILGRRDAGGTSVAEAIVAFGQDPRELPAAAVDRRELLGYFEAHIEQGPALEAGDLPVGVVRGIAGQMRARLLFVGKAGHAGTVPMHLRRDPLPVAARWCAAVEDLARATDGLVATIGRVAVHPGAANVIPGEVRLDLDLRHPDDAVRQSAWEALQDRARELAAERDVETTVTDFAAEGSMHCDAALRADLAAAVAASGQRVHELSSGAGHDAVMMARVCPTAMLFVRCRGGVSHSPEEHVEAADVAVALEVMLRFVLRLAAARTTSPGTS